MRTYAPRNRATLIEQRNQNSLTQLLKDKELTLEQKHELVRERNEFLFLFGDHLLVRGDEDYATYINKLYLGA